MKSFLILVYIIISPNFFFAQKTYNDFSVILHEETINKVFAAVGEISGKNEFEALLIKGHYKWTVVNPKINLLPLISPTAANTLLMVSSCNMTEKSLYIFCAKKKLGLMII